MKITEKIVIGFEIMKIICKLQPCDGNEMAICNKSRDVKHITVWCRQQLGPLNSSWPYGTNSILRVPSPSMLPLSQHWWQNAKYAILPPSSLPKDSGAVLYSAYIISLYTCKLRNGEMLKGREQAGLMQLQWHLSLTGQEMRKRR